MLPKRTRTIAFPFLTSLIVGFFLGRNLPFFGPTSSSAGTRHNFEIKGNPTTIPPPDESIDALENDCRKTELTMHAKLFGMSKNIPKVQNPQRRDDWIKSKIKSLSSPASLPRRKALDLSAGGKPYESTFISNGFQYFSSEFEGNAIVTDRIHRFDEKNMTTLSATHDFIGKSIVNPAIPSNHFDVVINTEVLEHLPEPLLAVREMARVVKEGGDVIITAPFTSGTHQLPFHFSSGYSREWYRHAAALYGLKVVEIVSQGDCYELMAQEIGRMWTCGLNPAEVTGKEEILRDVMKTAMTYMLLKSRANDANSAFCFDMFTIGWMVHLRKT